MKGAVPVDLRVLLERASPRELVACALAVVSAYPVLVSLLRFRRLRKVHKKYNYPTRESFARMTDDDAFEIQRTLLQTEFPFMFAKALQFALFRVSCCTILRGLPRIPWEGVC